MAQYGGQYGDSDRRQNDEYGSTIRQTDEFGNPVQQTGYGNNVHGSGTGGAAGATRGIGFSSSEDDGQDGRRKKGITEKIKEMIPGMGGKDEQQQQQQQQQQAGSYPTSTAASGGYGAEPPGQQQEKKGMMDKIKEKLPGH